MRVVFEVWASLGSSERPKDLKDIKTMRLLRDRYKIFLRPGHLWETLEYLSKTSRELCEDHLWLRMVSLY
ncbi:hypothetical protein BYT27DRAFT_7304839 [Phlegmacium glaucopus]|nr:hypothetical protein BYT27DRAFT_7304839 [Phlegmacium glaucopus]